MKTEIQDLIADKRRHNALVMAALANYCYKQRMVGLDLRRFPSKVSDQIINETVDLFIDRVRQHQSKTPPGKGANSGDGKPGVGGLSRG